MDSPLCTLLLETALPTIPQQEPTGLTRLGCLSQLHPHGRLKPVFFHWAQTQELHLASAVRVGWWAAPDPRPSLASGLENCDHLLQQPSLPWSVCLCLSICSKHSCPLLSSSLTSHVCCLQQLPVPRWSFSGVHGQPRLGLPR